MIKLGTLVIVLCCEIITGVHIADNSSLNRAAHQDENIAVPNKLEAHAAVEFGNTDKLNSLPKDSVPDGGFRYNNQRTSVDTYSISLEEANSTGVHFTPSKKALNNRSSYPQNCREIQQNGYNVSGVYQIYPKYAKEPFLALCDMETMGGGWTHIQKRFDGSVDFVREWRYYKFGFGNLAGEFWMGLENLYVLTAFEESELLVEIVDRDNISAFAHYNSFAIGSEPGGYVMEKLAGFSGDAGDSLNYHLGSKFSTKDYDDTESNCSTQCGGGWWYKLCHHCNLNGKFINLDLPDKYKYKGLHWKTFRSHEYCHAKSRILVRPSK